MLKIWNTARWMLSILFTAVVLLSCEALFTTNIFESVDQLDLSNMSSEEKAVAVLDDAEGALDGMSDSEVQDLLDDLSDLYSESSDPDTKKQAAAAYSEVVLTESGADETITNLNDLATDLIDDPASVDSPADIISSIFSDENGNPLSASEVEAQLDAMLASASALAVYGSVLGADGDAPAGVNEDELALTALVVGMVDLMYDGGTNSTADIAAAITGSDPETELGALGLPDLSALTADGGITTVFGADLGNTIEASGTVTSLLDMMG